MKPIVQWFIEKYVIPYKMKGSWENWDGPFRSEKLARKRFDESYRLDGPEKDQDFRIVKSTTEAVPFQVKSTK